MLASLALRPGSVSRRLGCGRPERPTGENGDLEPENVYTQLLCQPYFVWLTYGFFVHSMGQDDCVGASHGRKESYA